MTSDASPSSPSVRSVAEQPSLSLRACLDDPLLDVMNFLNEIVTLFPTAISFAPGRPRDATCHTQEYLEDVWRFVAHGAIRRDVPVDGLWNELGQYGRTNGIVGELVAAHLAVDEGIHVRPDSVMVTVGAQEAMAVVLMGLFEPSRDVLLVSDPTYIGITGLARLLGIKVVPVPSARDGLQADAVDAVIRRVAPGQRVRALYDIPDFNNPCGTSVPLAERYALLDLCARRRLLLIEDNPYGMFAYDQPRMPTLKSLDTTGTVVYVGSFAKTLCPGMRLGYLVADQPTTAGVPLAQALSRVKSLTTVNTPPLMQAAVAGALLRAGGSLEPIVAPKRAQYRQQRECMLRALDDAFLHGPGGVHWSRPPGGFFLTVHLPFEFGPEELRCCAAEYGVIVSPMRFFCIGQPRLSQVRLSFSYEPPERIAEGVRRFAAFVGDTVAGSGRTDRVADQPHAANV